MAVAPEDRAPRRGVVAGLSALTRAKAATLTGSIFAIALRWAS